MFIKPAILKIFLSVVLFFLFLVNSPQIKALSLTLIPTDDAMVGARPDIENNTFGTWDLLEIGYDTTNSPPWAFFAMLKFNTNVIPSDATITKATFRFYLQQISNSISTIPSYKISRAKTDWSEKTVTWKNKPDMDVATSTINFTNTVGYKEWDVKKLVNEWRNGTYPNYGFYVASVTRTNWISTFYSKEGKQKPQLIVEFTLPNEESKIIIPNPLITPTEVKIIADPYIKISDVVPPIISNVKVLNAGVTSATVTWTTNENSTSYVDYGDTENYTQQKGQNDSVKTHEVILDNLIPLKTYHFMVKSSDGFGNQGKSTDDKFLQFKNFLPIGGVGNKEIPEPPVTQNQDANSTQTDSTISTTPGGTTSTPNTNTTGVGFAVDDLLINQLEGTPDATSTNSDKTTENSKQVAVSAKKEISLKKNIPNSVVPLFTVVAGTNSLNLILTIAAIIILLGVVAVTVVLLLRKNKTLMVSTPNLKPRIDNMTKKVIKNKKLVLVLLVIATLILLVVVVVTFYFFVNPQSNQIAAPVVKTTVSNPTQEKTWKTYTNTAFNFTVEYPSDWTYREFPDTKEGAVFYPLSNTNSDNDEFISVGVGRTLLNYVNMPLEEYAKMAGSETQNYNELVSFKKITTLTGAVGYRTTWDVQPMTINGVPPTSKGSESSPITYFEIPNSKSHLVRAILNKVEYLPIYEKMLTTVKVMTPSIPVPTIDDTSVLKNIIKKYIALKHGGNESSYTITVSKIEGDYAKGEVSSDGSGGIWFASKEVGIWVLLWDGNGIIECSTFDLYPNFSKNLVPQCYDTKTETIVTR